MKVRKFAVGPLETNCYVIADGASKKAIVVDPGDEPDIIIEFIRKENLEIELIVCTHAHFDHVGAIPELKEETNASIALHADELEIYEGARDQAAFWGYDLQNLPKPDKLLREGDVIRVGQASLMVLHTPGHSPGSLCLFGEGLLISGDTLFAGSVGRTDFFGGDINKLKKSFSRLMSLPPETRVFSGHGPQSTIGKEKAENFFSDEL